MYDIPANEIVVKYPNGKQQIVKGDAVKMILECLELHLTKKEKTYIRRLAHISY